MNGTLQTTKTCQFSILLPALVLFLATVGYGQGKFDRFRHISTSDGFSLNSVNSFDQDEKGLIWLGTRNGLMRYDGTELKVIRREEGDFDTRRINDIYSIFIDPGVGVWMSTQNGLSLYYNKGDSSRDFSYKESSPLSTSSRLTYDVHRVSPTEVWIGTHGGLNVYDEEAQVIRTYDHDVDDPESISSNQISVIYKTTDGTIWLGSYNGLNKLVEQAGDNLVFKRYYIDSSAQVESTLNRISCIQEDLKGNLWVGTPKGLYHLDVDEEKFERYEETLTSEIITALTYDHSNRLWVGTYDGLNILDNSNLVLSQVQHDPKRLNGLTGNHVRALFTDAQGGIWIATYYGGVNYWDDKQMNFRRIEERSGTQLGYNVVSTIIEDKNQNIYFGTEGAGVNILDPVTNQFSKIDELGFGNPMGSIKDILYGSGNRLWIATFDKGLIDLDLDTHDFKEYRSSSTQTNTISTDQLLSLAMAEDGKIWIGTINRGLDLFDPKKHTFKTFNADPETPAIPNNNVRALLIDSSGDLYVGTGDGLCMLTREAYDSGDFVFEFFEMGDGGDDHLYIHDIFEDDNGELWLGAHNSGLYFVEGRKIINVGLNGVTTVFAITQASDGKLWLSTEEGVVSFDPNMGEQEIFDRKDGVHPNEFNRGARLTASDGTIYFGGASGVTTFHPSMIGLVNDYAPNVVLTRFTLLGEDLRANDETDILKKPIEYTDKLTLNYDQNIFSIGFAMPNFINSDKNSYKYRLRGLDDHWVTTSNPFVSFTIQRGGDYVFEVQGINSGGMVSPGITSLNIEVKNAPWLTWWAYLIYFIVVASALLLFIYFFKSRLRLQHKLELETRELNQQKEVHQQKLQFFTNISHEFRTPLTLISGPLEILLSDYNGPSYIYRQLLVIKKNTDQLFKLINELMDFRKLENKQMKLKAAEGNIVHFAKEIFLSFDQQAKLNKLDYRFHANKDEIKVFFDRDKLEKVLYNLISNAFKFTAQGGTIEVMVKQKRSSVRISVKDNGEGIQKEYLDKIFDRFYEIPKQKSHIKAKSGSGIGLAIAKNIVDLHKGELRVISELGKGSKFTLELKSGKDHLSEDEIIKTFKSSEDITLYAGEVLQDAEKYTQEDNGYPDKNGDHIPKVLIAEDNKEIGQFIRNVMRQHFEVILVENGALGYQEAIAIQPNLIISDVMMPVMDGIEFCSKIKSDERTSHIPFILLTARTSLIYKYDGLESGADEYLSKPFEIKELLLKSKNIISTQERLKSRFNETGELLPKEGAVNSIDEVMMNKAVQIIRENIGNEFLSIQLLCDKLGISRSLLFTKFKAWTDQTPNDYILTLRMKHAASLIEKDKANISEIGYKVGFRSANYFSKSFKKYYSMSPKEYSGKFKNSLGIEE